MNIKYMDWEDVPEEWKDRCSGDGWTKHKNKYGEWIYDDIGDSVDGLRPCAKCGEFPGNDRGDDACITNLGNVMNACCGHGKQKGYIQFDNGITIRGYFEIEKSKKYNKEVK